MIGTRGIDQDVQSTVDAYRGNPDALAKRYSQNQQLIDLLALQKLKSEKESAVREMQMKMGGQQMPTIADAREQEVLDLTKQELAQQATGAMQQQQRQKQQAAKQLVEQTAQAPAAGVAGLPAPNIAPQAMATGGIVAFQAGGEPPAQVDEPPVYSEEELRQRILRGEAPAPAPASVRQSGNMGSLARQGIMRLLGSEDPQKIYERRMREATEASGYTPQERAVIERQIADRAAMDAARFNPERRRSEGLTRWLLGAAGRTGIGSVLGGAGATAVNYDAEMDQAERSALTDRQKQEAGLVDVGPAARLAGMKLGSEAEKLATQGLHYGVDAAARLEAAQLAAARAAGTPEEKKITAAYQAFSQNPEIRSLLKKREEMNLPIDSPEVVAINQRIYDIAAPIFRGRGLDPDIFIPRPPTPTAAPTPAPGLGSMIWNALTPNFGGGSTQSAPRPRTSGAVDPNNPLLR